jgi:3-methylfumaryl-CoA hydratase
MATWDAWIGRTQEQSDILTPGLLARFRATLDSETTNRSESAGDIAPQGIHWCLCLPDAATGTLGPDGHPARGGFMPPVPLPRRMWSASDVTFLAPIPLGAAITRRSVITDIAEKSGASGALVFVTIAHETWADGTLSIDERQTVVYRDAPLNPAAAIAPPAIAAPDINDWPVRRIITPDEPLLFRYSALTFNSHRIHYDHPYATGVEGYSGLVVHGPLIATLLLDLAAREFGPNGLRKFTMRAVSPAFAGNPLHLVMRSGDKDGGRIGDKMLHLAAINQTGHPVMTATAERA